VPFSPEEIEKKDFLLTLRGYDKEEVRAFLESVAADYATLTEAARDKEVPSSAYEDIGREVSTVIQAAKESSAEMRRQAEAAAHELRARAEREATRIRESATQAAERLHAEADRYAVETRAATDRETAGQIEASRSRLERLQSTEAKVRQRLYALEATIQNLRRELDVNESAGADVLELNSDGHNAGEDLDDQAPVAVVLDEPDATDASRHSQRADQPVPERR
jgi:DivIVA domain-containing protein